MDKATYNNLRLKAYYWEKQILRGREDPLAQERYKHFTERLEEARAALAAAAAERKAQKAKELEKKALEWRKVIRRTPAKGMVFDTLTQIALDKSLEAWKPSLTIEFE